MKVSVIIPCLNDAEILKQILPTVLVELPEKYGEVIVIDNGSAEPVELPEDPRVRVIRNQINVGVGGAFNQGAELAKGSKLVLMGADVIPGDGWFDRVLETMKGNSDAIFCAVSVNPQKKIKRYGANILYKMSTADLPDNSPNKDNPKFYRILQAKWNDDKPEDYIATIECLLGAFYWMSKAKFKKIHGWNGHRMWGSLEPFLSLKARAHGMCLALDQGLEAIHTFGRPVTRPKRADLQFFNMLFMAHTMFSDALRDELVDYLLYGDGDEKLGRLNVNQAMHLLKRVSGLVAKERQYNNKHFKHGLISNWEKFNTEII